MSSNLLKMGFASLQDVEKRVIDTNELAARRIEEMTAHRHGAEGMETSEPDAGGFFSGLNAERVDGASSDEGDELHGNVIKADPPSGETQSVRPDPEKLVEEARVQAEEILAQAREDAQDIRRKAQKDAEAKREKTLADAREQGYREGREQAQSEYAVKERELEKKRKDLEAEYQGMVDELEPKFVDALTGVYGHLFGVELSSYRAVLLYLIDAAVRRIEGRNFLVHVSAEDYPYVTMEKKTLLAALTSPGATLELVEDHTLKHNECMIETEGGIFDCGLGTQLTELGQKLSLLSYEKEVSR